MTWTLLRLVAEAKGYNFKELSARLRKRFPNREGLGSSAIYDKANLGKKAPREVADFITSDAVNVRKGYETPAKVVRMGLAAWRGEPSPAIGKRLDTLGNKLDSANGKLDSNGGKLDALQAAVAEMRAEQKSARHVTGTVLGLLLLLGLFAGRQLLTSTSNAVAPPSAAAAFRLAVGHLLDLGKKSDEYWIPAAPYPWQKLAKDCNASLGEEAINGGCWVPVERSRKAPPCGELFRHGDICYRPVAADPTKPVGLVRTVPGQH
ncbi:MAG TPA: hypothetical protein VK447_20545 [Myxococcaceae bacterium]|nr:hypothetical protein [Myxococcaceae bacterium]